MNNPLGNDLFIYVAGNQVVVAGELDIASAPEVEASVELLAGDIFLDCSGVTFIDMAGLRALLAIHGRCADRNTRLLVEPSPCLTRLLVLTGLGSFINSEAPTLSPSTQPTEAAQFSTKGRAVGVAHELWPVGAAPVSA